MRKHSLLLVLLLGLSCLPICIKAWQPSVILSQLDKEGLAQPCALASADFDEDGMPDLILGYSRPGGGFLGLYRGNLGSVYTNHAQAQQQKAINSQEDSAFHSPTRLIELAHTPDFLAAGDFNADGHCDVVATTHSSRSLYLLAGNGHGGFAAATEITLPGTVTSLTSPM